MLLTVSEHDRRVSGRLFFFESDFEAVFCESAEVRAPDKKSPVAPKSRKSVLCATVRSLASSFRTVCNNFGEKVGVWKGVGCGLIAAFGRECCSWLPLRLPEAG